MYRLEYDTKVDSDIKKLGGAEKKRIKHAVNERLLIDPTLYGKPLQHSLFSLRSFRVGDYRVLFKLEADCIFIVHIGHRKQAYPIARKRIT